eukprot:4452856-Ditylum_brightwellii.AAC.1
MRIAKDFLREAIQLAATKRCPIAFEVKEGVTDKKLGEIRTYKLCTQPEEGEAGATRIEHGQYGCYIHLCTRSMKG